MARFGGLFHLFRTIPKAFKKKRRFDNVLHEFRRRLPSPVKNSTAQNGTKTLAQDPFCSLSKPEASSTRRHAISKARTIEYLMPARLSLIAQRRAPCAHLPNHA
jgi:hypothetical protein